MGEVIRFVEVAPRDGFQNWPDAVSTEIKERLVRDLLGAGVETVEATSFVSPKWVPQMADAAELLRRLGPDLLPHLRVLVPNLTGFERGHAAENEAHRTGRLRPGIDGHSHRGVPPPGYQKPGCQTEQA